MWSNNLRQRRKKLYRIHTYAIVLTVIAMFLLLAPFYSASAQGGLKPTCRNIEYVTKDFCCYGDELIPKRGEERCLEQTYPKIYLPPPIDGSYSLQDIFHGVGPFSTVNAISGLILYIFALSISLVGLIAFAALIFTGVQFLMSGGRPLVRAQLKRRLSNIVLGAALLFGVVIILNVINPDLTKLKVPSITGEGLSFSWPGVNQIDLDTLQYGGVVLYESADPAMDGGTLRSEVVLNDIENFNNANWVRNGGLLLEGLSAIAILGDCTITVFENAGFSGASYTIAGPITGIYSDPGMGFPNDKISSLRFKNKDCLGNSIRAYRDEFYIRDSKDFILDDDNLSGDWLLPGPPDGGANDEISSIKFARESFGDFIVTLCQNRNKGGLCVSTTLSDEDFRADDSPVPEALNNEISSIYLGGGGENRQAGVLLYENSDYGGVSELFIKTDANIDNDNSLEGLLAGGQVTSAIKILGEYIVHLWDDENFAGDVFTIDNSSGSPVFSGDVILPPRTSESDYYINNIVQIPNLDDFARPGGGDWNDRIRSIEIIAPD